MQNKKSWQKISAVVQPSPFSRFMFSIRRFSSKRFRNY